jgi:hypothetical protein
MQRKKHITEKKYPGQVAEFKKILADLYALHLQKNSEYSPANIKVLGQLGVSLRLIEKIIRALNLQGFDALAGKLVDKPKVVKYGSVEEEFKDIATLAIIAMILPTGKWGK